MTYDEALALVLDLAEWAAARDADSDALRKHKAGRYEAIAKVNILREKLMAVDRQ